MTPYSLLLSLTGLSHKSAAVLHGVRLDTVKSWASGRRNAPPDALDQLRDLHDKIGTVADNLIEHVQDMDLPDDIPLEIAACMTDAEARERGLPFAACHHQAIAQALTCILNPVSLVPVTQSVAALAHAPVQGHA